MYELLGNLLPHLHFVTEITIYTYFTSSNYLIIN